MLSLVYPGHWIRSSAKFLSEGNLDDSHSLWGCETPSCALIYPCFPVENFLVFGRWISSCKAALLRGRLLSLHLCILMKNQYSHVWNPLLLSWSSSWAGACIRQTSPAQQSSQCAATQWHECHHISLVCVHMDVSKTMSEKWNEDKGLAQDVLAHCCCLHTQTLYNFNT